MRSASSIERDATTLYHARKGTSRPIDLASISSPVVLELIAQIRDAGFDLWLIDQTSDLGIPTFQAIIGDPSLDYSRHFDLATGYGCHPTAERALIRAITEAAQTRVTNIAGSRDDFVPDEYGMALHRALIDGLRDGTESAVALPAGCAPGTPLRGDDRRSCSTGSKRAGVTRGDDGPDGRRRLRHLRRPGFRS